MNKEKKILIIASAALEGGALTILTQFLTSIPIENRHNYVIFVSSKITDFSFFIGFEYYKVDTSQWLLRIYHDMFGYGYLIRKLKINVDVCINFQNIPSRVHGLKQIVYMHQSLPFYHYKWNLLKKSDFKYWLYQNFYSIFIRLNKNFATSFIVQSKWIANALAEKISFDRNKVIVCKPGVSEIFKDNKRENNINGKTFIYPAAEYEYKNHAVIIQALSMLGNEYLKENNVSVLFTIPANSYLDKKTKTMDIYKHVRFIGSVNQEELNRLYSTSFCLLFPSKIESFGLPLIEGACKGVKIITADLPYAREALQDYASTHFVDPDDASKWAYKLKSLIEKDDNKTETFEYKDDWAKFNKIIDDVFFSN